MVWKLSKLGNGLMERFHGRHFTAPCLVSQVCYYPCPVRGLPIHRKRYDTVGALPGNTKAHEEWGATKAPDFRKRFALRSRRHPTRHEAILLQHLDASWRAQAPIGPYVLDFFCDVRLLAIEIDGSTHRNLRRYDAKRDAYFRRIGIRTIRFTNDDVENRLSDVIETITRETH